MFLIYYCLLPLVGFLGLTIWETKVFQQREAGFEVELPSEKIWKFMEWAREWSYVLGRIIARYVNPLYYVRQFWPHIKLYFLSAQRLIVSMLPPVFPGWSFVKGFFSNALYGITTVLILLGIVGWWLKDKIIVPDQVTSEQRNMIYTTLAWLMFVVMMFAFVLGERLNAKVASFYAVSTTPHRRTRRSRRLASRKTVEIEDSDKSN